MDFGQQYAGVALVLCLLGGTLWWLRRRGYATGASGRRHRRLEALERLPLGPQHTLHLVRVGRTVAVVLCSPGGCTLLQTLPGEDGAAGGGQ
jgi:flagellar biosynthetic protein FliO